MIPIKKFNEMPHIKVKNNFYDLELEDHIKDSPIEFMQYIKNFVGNNKLLAQEILNNELIQGFIKKYIGNWNEVYNYLKSIY